MSLETWLLFSGAALVVILIPGPLSLLMISNSLNYGLRRSYPAFLGGVSASICLLSASALGLGALLLASEQLFSALKIVGALYLFYLAWQSWQQSRLPSDGAEVPQAAPVPRFRALFGRAFMLGASNPKDILFFAAFPAAVLECRAAVPAAIAGDDRDLDRAGSAVQVGLWPGRPWCGAVSAQRQGPELVQPDQCRVVRWCGGCVPAEPLRSNASRAGSLPQGICDRRNPMWERACSRWRQTRHHISQDEKKPAV